MTRRALFLAELAARLRRRARNIRRAFTGPTGRHTHRHLSALEAPC